MMPNPIWPIRIRVDAMLLLLLIWAALAALAWAVVHVGARDDPPEWDEPDVQPGDPYQWSFTDASPPPADIRWVN